MLNSGYKARHSARPSQERPDPGRGGATTLRAAAGEAGPDASRVQVTIIIGLAVALVVIVTYFATPR